MDGPFDRRRVRVNRNRAALRFPDHRFLHDLALERLTDRLGDIRRSFPLAVCFSPPLDAARRAALCAAGGIEALIQADLAERRLDPAAGPCVQTDAEYLPFGDGTVDLVLSALDLHTVNDLPGALIQARRALRPDGVFAAALWGGQTLSGLRSVLAQTEITLRGGAGPRISPFADAPVLAALMQRAGFALPVVDSEKIAVTYQDPMRLFADLKGMGEGSAMTDRPRSVPPKGLFRRAASLMAGSDVVFEMMFLIGWVPHESQPRPLKPGSASVRLADVLE